MKILTVAFMLLFNFKNDQQAIASHLIYGSSTTWTEELCTPSSTWPKFEPKDLQIMPVHFKMAYTDGIVCTATVQYKLWNTVCVYNYNTICFDGWGEILMKQF